MDAVYTLFGKKPKQLKIWIILLNIFSIDQSVAMSLSKDIGGTGGGADPNPVDRRSFCGRHDCSHTEYMMDFFGGEQSCYLTGDLDKVLIIHGNGSFPEVSGVNHRQNHRQTKSGDFVSQLFH